MPRPSDTATSPTRPSTLEYDASCQLVAGGHTGACACAIRHAQPARCSVAAAPCSGKTVLRRRSCFSSSKAPQRSHEKRPALVARSAGLFSCAVVTRNTQRGKMPADRNGHANCVWPSRKTAAPRAAWLRRVEQLCLCSCERASIRPLYARIALRSFTLSLLTEKRKKPDNARLGGLLQSTPTTRTSEPPRGEPTRGSMGEGGGQPCSYSRLLQLLRLAEPPRARPRGRGSPPTKALTSPYSRVLRLLRLAVPPGAE